MHTCNECGGELTPHPTSDYGGNALVTRRKAPGLRNPDGTQHYHETAHDYVLHICPKGHSQSVAVFIPCKCSQPPANGGG